MNKNKDILADWKYIFFTFFVKIINTLFVEHLACYADKEHTAKRTESIDELLITTIYGIQFSGPSVQKSHVRFEFYRKLDAEAVYMAYEIEAAPLRHSLIEPLAGPH